ncbi:conserved protein of unknown function [Acidithiobacillus ferrivorans]|uniref:Type I-E CRISPR-associated protein Cas6/Cse3/CasE n=1 Tax=Acidithiobacillus ferrivorans TaxID=160808 RepID=A0A060UVP9_9PROT|nr:type I-E CRISPR-associated protein Cas6/Cse3/CasE [Acidithiobacillus ferrivorans]CDQ10634.1 conserved hypothetical protein [Acidithiobacillus ferrivorans]SMH64663.1 conserved protein of unknown function [Acidithiobacillus ferrivorans]
MITNEYLESRITFPLADVPDLYAIHQRVMAVTEGDKSITYAPAGHDLEGRMVVVMRSKPGIVMPVGTTAERKSVEYGITFTIRAGVRLVKQTRYGERMPTVDEAMEKWTNAMSAGSFLVANTRMVESAIAFHHQRLGQRTRLPFWAVSSTLTVVDSEKAAETMVRGVGRSRGLGFGMLMVA